MFDILFLGTGASVPSRDRALPSIAVRRGPDIVLLDCGEGTQRQLMISPFSLMKVRAILVTHMHGDHFYGLPGLLQTMGMMNRSEPLLACGPDGFSDAVREALGLCDGEIPYPLELRDVNPGDAVDIGDLRAEVFATSHGIASRGYVIREPDQTDRIDKAKADALGLKSKDIAEIAKGGTVDGYAMADIAAPDRRGASIAYTGDTMPCASIDDAIEGVDVLIHESTYSAEDRALADEHFHSTCADAAEAAKRAGAKALFLFHTSNRYKDKSKMLEEARKIFPEAYLPDDLALYRMTRNGIRSA